MDAGDDHAPRRASSCSRCRPRAAREGVGLFHASPRDPVWEYVLSGADRRAVPRRHGLPRLVHRPLARRAVLPPPRGRAGDRLDAPRGRPSSTSPTGEWLINPGTTGQPRDGDPRAAWLLLDTDALDRATGAAPSTTSRARRRRSGPPACPTRSPSASSTGSEPRRTPRLLDASRWRSPPPWSLCRAAGRLRQDEPEADPADRRRARSARPSTRSPRACDDERLRRRRSSALARRAQRRSTELPRKVDRAAASATCSDWLDHLDEPDRPTDCKAGGDADADADRRPRRRRETPTETPTTDAAPPTPTPTATPTATPTRRRRPRRRRCNRPATGGVPAGGRRDGTDAALRRPLPARAPPRRRRHVDRPARVRHAARALRRGQAAGRAPGRGRELRLALPPRGAGRGAARAPEHRAGVRLRPRRRAPSAQLHRHGVRRRPVVRRDPARPRAARRRATRSTSSPRPAAGSTTRTATASCTATSSRATCCAAATAWSSSPTSASPRRPSSRTSRRSARCSAPPPTCRPSRRAASRPARPSDLYALGVVSYQLLAGRLPYEAASLTDLARLQEAGPPPRLDELDPRRPAARSADGGHARAAPATRGAATRTPPRWSDALRDGLRGRRSGARHGQRRGRSTTPRRRGCWRGTQATTGAAARAQRAAPPARADRRAAAPPPPAPAPAAAAAAAAAGAPKRELAAAAHVARAAARARVVVAGVLALPGAAGRRRSKACSCKRERPAATCSDAVDQVKSLIEDNTR